MDLNRSYALGHAIASWLMAIIVAVWVLVMFAALISPEARVALHEFLLQLTAP